MTFQIHVSGRVGELRFWDNFDVVHFTIVVHVHLDYFQVLVEVTYVALLWPLIQMVPINSNLPDI